LRRDPAFALISDIAFVAFVDKQRMAVLDELAKEAQELGMGY
jgi:hypothetical protein